MTARLRGVLRGALGKTGLYGASAILSGIVSLAAIPLLVEAVGTHEWASLVTGQAIGQSIAVLAIFGWGLTGPSLVARTPVGARAQIFLDSLVARLVLVAPLLVIQAVATILIVPHAKGPAFLTGTAMMLAGASANWYFTGEGRADRYFLLDSVPRITGTVLGVGLTALTHDLYLYALAQLAGSVVALVLSSIVVLRGSRLAVRDAFRGARVWRSLREQRHGVVATGLWAMATPAVLGVIALGAPAALPVFVFADRVGRLGAMVIWPITGYYQGWVPGAEGLELVARLRRSGGVIVTIATVGAVFDALLLPVAADLASGGQIVIDPATAVGLGIVAGISMISPWLTTAGLLTVGRVRAVAVTAIVGVPAQVALVALAELSLEPPLVALALAVSAIAILGWQFALLGRATAELRSDAAPTPLPAAVGAP